MKAPSCDGLGAFSRSQREALGKSHRCIKLSGNKVQMKKLNLYEMYLFGKNMAAASSINRDDHLSAKAIPLWFARQKLNNLGVTDSPLLNSSKRAAAKVVAAITEVIPNDLDAVFSLPKDATFEWQAESITGSIVELESVLGNDMPDIAAYIVSQKGIFRTDDLITHAEYQLSQAAREMLPTQACSDLQQAGKCLAYELGTACTFHLWRAVESVIGFYYVRITTHSLQADQVQRNWGAYIRALKDKGANVRITSFLDHIRSEYRNPQTHPDEDIPIDEALRLFSVATSVIEQMLREPVAPHHKVAETSSSLDAAATSP